MNWSIALRTGMHRSDADACALFLYDHPKEVDALIDFVRKGVQPHSRKAAWVLGITSENKPDFLLPFRRDFIDLIEEVHDQSCLREILRILVNSPMVADNGNGPLLDHCMKILQMPEADTGVRYNALKICIQLAHLYPDTIPELISILEHIQEWGSDAFKYQCGKQLMQLMNGGKN